MDNGSELGDIEIFGGVAGGAVKDATAAEATFPDDRHDGTFDPLATIVIAGECRSGDHIVAGIHVHVVLLGVDGKIGDIADDGVVGFNNVDRVGDLAAGVSDEVTADHELKVSIGAERVAEAAMPASDACAGADGGEEVVGLLRGYRAHGPNEDDEVEVFEAAWIVKDS